MPDPDPIIFGGLTQAQLDQQYDQSTAVPHVADYVARWEAAAERVRARLHPETYRYGASEPEAIDLYPGTGDGVHLHLHGGAWRALSRPTAGFVAEGLAAAGPRPAVAGFGLAPGVRLAEMVAQVRRAFLWLRARFGPVTVSGHSSGAHLAACLLDGRWWRAEGLGAADFGAVLLASGAYDLEPVRLSARNLYLTLDEAEAADLSPARHLADRLPPVAAVWGDGELPEFARQSRALGAALRSRRADAVVEALRDRNHFDVWDDFADPASRVCALLRGLPGGRTEGAPGHIAERGIAGGPPA